MGYAQCLVKYFICLRKEGLQYLGGHLLSGHVHVFILTPSKLAFSSIIGFIKGKCAIYITRNSQGKRQNFVCENFWARGFYVSTVGLDEAAVRDYIRKQEQEDLRIEQLLLM